MDDGDDVPPLLVEADHVDAAETALATEMKDVKLARVPITIITGTTTTPQPSFHPDH
jgi:hypothetical protein